MQELADLFSISAEQRASKQNFFKLPEILKPTIDDQEDEEKKRTRTISFNEDILKEIEDQPQIVPQIMTDSEENYETKNDQELVVAEGKWP